MPRSAALLVNPQAGRGAAVETAEHVFRRLLAAGVHADLLRGTDAVHARALTRSALESGVDTVVVVGGDGLVHLAVQELAGSGAALAIVPSGTGNDIARSFGIDGEPETAVTAILSATPVPTDLVRVDASGGVASHWYLGVACSGFDSRINARANHMRRPRGPSKYTVALLSEVRDVAPVPMTVTVDGVAETRPSLLVAVGNTAYYGGGMAICVGATADDGLLDVIHIDAVGRARVLRLFPRLFSGSHLSLDIVHRRQGRVVTISIDDPSYAGTIPPVYADGEDAAALPVTFTCEPGALPVYR